MALAALALFFHACGYDFLTWDRELFSERSPATQGMSWAGLLSCFQIHSPSDSLFGPLVIVSHMLDFQIFGIDPVSHHLTSIWLHALNVFLLFTVARALGSGVWAAAVGAALFAFHSAQVAAVVWILQRRILLATLFVLATLWRWLRFRRSAEQHLYLYFQCLAFFVLAALAYPAAGIALALVLLYVQPVEQQIAQEALVKPRGWRLSFLQQTPFWICSIGILIWGHVVASVPTASRQITPETLPEISGRLATTLLDVFSSLTISLWKLISLSGPAPAGSLDPGPIGVTSQQLTFLIQFGGPHF